MGVSAAARVHNSRTWQRTPPGEGIGRRAFVDGTSAGVNGGFRRSAKDASMHKKFNNEIKKKHK